MEKSENIQEQLNNPPLIKFQICKTYFTSIPTIGGKLYSNHTKDMENVKKGVSDYNTGKNVSGGVSVFNDGVIYIGLVNISHNIKHLYGRCFVGTFEIFFHEVYIWGVHREVIPSIMHK